MKDHLISMFIDNELDLDEKMEFVEEVHGSPSFRDESIALLRQERLLRSDPVRAVPAVEPSPSRCPILPRWRSFLYPAGMLGSAIAAAMIVFAAFTFFAPPPVTDGTDFSHRFVIYKPEAETVEITGSFTGWRKMPLRQLGTSGYWEVTLAVPGGEHRFTYILDGDREYADPTVPAREHDDFGGENSILFVELSV